MKKMFNAGANRYLLRHETADEKHYGLLHPGEMSYKHRVQCLESLRRSDLPSAVVSWWVHHSRLLKTFLPT